MEDNSGQSGNGQRGETDDDSKQALASGLLGAGNRPRQQHEPEDGDGNFEGVQAEPM